MRQVKVLNGQTVFDVAIQNCGSVDAAYDIAILNNIEVTSYPESGTVLSVPDPIDKKVVQYYQQNEIKPATAYMSNPYNFSPMSLKTKNPNYNLASGDYTSEALQLDGSFAVAQAQFTNLTGTGFEVSLQQSIDGSVWGDVPNSTKELTAGAAVAMMWNIPFIPAGAYLRVKCSVSGNSGYFTTFKLLSNLNLAQ
ncbi:MAG: hypothetical protein IJK92_01295 [Bacteroidales bacterium]|nr:hypothetical protein [Bacteroidales bacterium]